MSIGDRLEIIPDENQHIEKKKQFRLKINHTLEEEEH